MLNISNSDIKKSDIITDGDTICYDITLVRKPMTCPYCGGKMIGHGHKLRLIKHPAIRNHSGIIRYNANRYICKECNKTAIEKNPFSFPGFNSSFLLLQNAMRLLANLNYTLSMISDELDISSTQLSTYIDSYITIPAALSLNALELTNCIQMNCPAAIPAICAYLLITKNTRFMTFLIQEAK